MSEQLNPIQSSSSQLNKAALDYHAKPVPGKVAISISKPCRTQQDLSLAYTPGVAEPVREINKNPAAAYQYTSKGNLVAVITDGSAVLGLGNVGALASKPVMEGKAVLFKQFANIDVFDIEINAASPEEFINTVENIAPTFGGINLEDIAAPHCFKIEEELIKRLDIPVFHDDQHGTAIITAAGLLNAIELQGKSLHTVKIVCLGAGAAATASMKLLVKLGAPKEHINLVDRTGVIHSEREHLTTQKRYFANKTNERTLTDALSGADVLIGLSGANLVSTSMLQSMSAKPIVFALSNPDPEISPQLALSTRKDLIMATGRSDYSNQVNNVLGFPFIFRGALDVRAKSINDEMKIAAVKALSNMAKTPVPKEVLSAYQLTTLNYGPEYIIPKPFDPRLIEEIPAAVARAAIDSKVANSGYPQHYRLIE